MSFLSTLKNIEQQNLDSSENNQSSPIRKAFQIQNQHQSSPQKNEENKEMSSSPQKESSWYLFKQKMEKRGSQLKPSLKNIQERHSRSLTTKEIVPDEHLKDQLQQFSLQDKNSSDSGSNMMTTESILLKDIDTPKNIQFRENIANVPQNAPSDFRTLILKKQTGKPLSLQSSFQSDDPKRNSISIQEVDDSIISKQNQATKNPNRRKSLFCANKSPKNPISKRKIQTTSPLENPKNIKISPFDLETGKRPSMPYFAKSNSAECPNDKDEKISKFQQNPP